MKTKSAIFYFLFILLAQTGKANDYWVETSLIDSLFVIIDGERTWIEPAKKKGTQSHKFSASPLDKIQLVCSDCDSLVSIKLFGVEEDAYTQTIYLSKKHSPILIKRLFDEYPEETFLARKYKSLRNAFRNYFFPKANEEREPLLDPSFQSSGSNIITKNDSIFSFSQQESTHFLSEEDFLVEFKILKDILPNYIYIYQYDSTELNSKIILYGGFDEVVEEYFPGQSSQKAKISDLLEVVKEEGDHIYYTLNWEKIAPYLISPLTAEYQYQIAVGIEIKELEPNDFRLIDFSIFDEDALDDLEKFLDGSK